MGNLTNRNTDPFTPPALGDEWLCLRLDAQFPDEATCFAGSVRMNPSSMVEPDTYVIDPTVQLDPDGASRRRQSNSSSRSA